MRVFVRLAILVMVTSMCGCDGATIISGDVTDLNGVPIGGATIRVTPTAAFKDVVRKPQVATTDDDGSFGLSFAHRPVRAEFTMTVTHEGYAEFQQVITSDGPNKNRVIRLKPLPDEE